MQTVIKEAALDLSAVFFSFFFAGKEMVQIEER